MYLYHGSNKAIEKKLVPHLAFKSYNKPEIYFTNNKILAMLFALNPIRDYFDKNNIHQKCGAFSCHFRIEENKITIFELYENMFNELFNQCTNIYVCKIPKIELEYDKSFPYEYKYSSACDIYKHIKIKNVLQELKNLEAQNKVNLLYYQELRQETNWKLWENLVDRISCRIYACNSKEEASFYYSKFGIIENIIKDIPFKFKQE